MRGEMGGGKGIERGGVRRRGGWEREGGVRGEMGGGKGD